MSNKALFESATRHVQAIDLCMANNLRMPALILVFSGIDIFSSLDRPSNKEEGTRKDFKNWCDKYLLPNANLPCSSTDIYAARCGVVHKSSSESTLSRKQKAVEIVYSWGTQDPEPLQSILKNLGDSTHVIHIESLVDAFKKAVLAFMEDIGNDSERIGLVLSRAAKMFIDQPKEFWH